MPSPLVTTSISMVCECQHYSCLSMTKNKYSHLNCLWQNLMGLHTLYGFLVIGTSGIESCNVVPSDSYMNWVWFVNASCHSATKSSICLYQCIGFSHLVIRGFFIRD